MDKRVPLVAALLNGLKILETLVHAERDSLGVTEIAGRLRMHKSTVLRLLLTLESQGYVEQDPRTREFRPRMKLFELGSAVLARADLVKVARPLLEELGAISGEVIHLSGQMGMIQDVINQKVDAIILSTHDEHAAAPLVKKAVEQGIVVVIVNSDIPNFPATVHAVVGYQQRKGTYKIGEYAIKMAGDKNVNVGILEGAPGYHSTERVGGFRDAIKNAPNFKVLSSLNGNWNVEGGNSATMDMLQAHPGIQLIFAANDYEIMGAAKAADALKKRGVILLGNDGDTAALEEIAAGRLTATVNTTPFVMGQVAMQVVMDSLNGKFKGGYVETPTVIVDKTNVLDYLTHPERLYPKPVKQYTK